MKIVTISMLFGIAVLFLATSSASAQSGYWAECLNPNTGQRYQCFVSSPRVVQTREPAYNYGYTLGGARRGANHPRAQPVYHQESPYCNEGYHPTSNPTYRSRTVRENLRISTGSYGRSIIPRVTYTINIVTQTRSGGRQYYRQPYRTYR